MAHVETSRAGNAHGSTKSYLIGFVRALLTVVPFALVMNPVLSRPLTLFLLVGFAVAQILVQLVYFLHMDRKSEGGWNLASFVFTLVILFIVVALGLDHLEHALPHDDQLSWRTVKGIAFPHRGLRLAAGLLLGLLAGCSAQSRMDFYAKDIACEELASIGRPDSHGTVRGPKDLQGQVTYLFFGFTSCPDVCPTTMVELSQVKHLMGKDADQLQVVFVSVDPARDTPEVARTYVEAFDPRQSRWLATMRSWPRWPATSRRSTKRNPVRYRIPTP